MLTSKDSSHIVVLRRGQFYWFDVLDDMNRPLLTEREILRNLQAITADADRTPITEFAKSAIGVLSTENRKVWSGLRDHIHTDKQNAGCLEVVDGALFVVCLDDAAPADLAQLCANFLCGTYELRSGVQIGTCTNRWYDKVSHSFNDNQIRRIKLCDSSRLSFVQMGLLVSTSSIPELMATLSFASRQTSSRMGSCSSLVRSTHQPQHSSMHPFHPMRNLTNLQNQRQTEHHHRLQSLQMASRQR